ncbi:hypothetical protein BGW41_000018 [Actinomortierella wolfii]|nr:hypothetical protein BGW41_000018 [Actinomortierella wolfii]
MVSSSMVSLARKLLVVGGTGGVGLQVCKLAVARGWDVVSLSRRGTPSRLDADSKTSTAWMDKVNWAKGDSLQPSTYQDLIKDTDAVVHTVGLLLEADYKDILHSQSVQELITAVQKSTRSENPLERAQQMLATATSSGSASSPPPSSAAKSGLTYEKVNRDTAITLAKEAEKAGTESFVFISAAFAPPMVPQRYLTTKREVETYLLSHLHQQQSSGASSPRKPTSASEPKTTTDQQAPKQQQEPSSSEAKTSSSPSTSTSAATATTEADQGQKHQGLRPIILRPGFMSTAERPATLPLAGLLCVSSTILGKSIRGTIPLAQYVSTPPLSMETVARAVMNAIENKNVKGILEVDDISTMATDPYAKNVGATKDV